MHDWWEEQKQLHSCENISQTHSPSRSKWNEIFRFLNLAFVIDKAARHKLFGVFPKSRVHVNAIDQRNNVTTGWYFVTIKLLITVNKAKQVVKLLHKSFTWVSYVHFFQKISMSELETRCETYVELFLCSRIHITSFRMRQWKRI